MWGFIGRAAGMCAIVAIVYSLTGTYKSMRSKAAVFYGVIGVLAWWGVGVPRDNDLVIRCLVLVDFTWR